MRILVTGGAGFIGSNLVAALAARGVSDIAVCDLLGSDDKWRNIAKHEIAHLVAPDDLFDFLAAHTGGDGRWGRVDTVFHLGANSSTTEADVDRIVVQNLSFTLNLWRHCSEGKVRLVYASSATTYGDGRAGFDDAADLVSLARLRPLNPYGWSKQVFDLWVACVRRGPR